MFDDNPYVLMTNIASAFQQLKKLDKEFFIKVEYCNK